MKSENAESGNANMFETTPAAMAQVAEYFKSLSEVSRLQIIGCLRNGRQNVTEIVEATGLSQANVSKHLKGLMQVGIVSRRPEGLNVYYQICDPIVLELYERVCDQLSAHFQHRAQQFLRPLPQTTNQE